MGGLSLFIRGFTRLFPLFLLVLPCYSWLFWLERSPPWGYTLGVCQECQKDEKPWFYTFDQELIVFEKRDVLVRGVLSVAGLLSTLDLLPVGEGFIPEV